MRDADETMFPSNLLPLRIGDIFDYASVKDIMERGLANGSRAATLLPLPLQNHLQQHTQHSHNNMPSCISVVRLGPDNVSAGMLRNAVLDFFGKKHGDAPSNDRLHVANKYFDAQIFLLASESSNSTTDQDLPLKEDGIILVFDAAQSNPDRPLLDAAASFGALGPVHDAAVAVGGGDLLRLCVGVTGGAMDATELRGQDYEKEYARRIHWCLDRGYEYVECDLSPEALLQGHDQRDKEGFARIVEALEGTMWSSAVMKKRDQLKKSYQEDRQQLEQPSEYVPPDPSMLLNNDQTREEQARQAIMEQSGIKEDGESLSNGQENISPDQSQQDREQERMFDNLESALRQAASIREMSRSGELSDDDRRKRAGDAANLLMSLMMQGGLDDESEAEDESPGGND